MIIFLRVFIAFFAWLTWIELSLAVMKEDGESLQTSSCSSYLASTWQGIQTLSSSPLYTLSWNISSDSTTITFMISITGTTITPKWIGFGLSESGHMLGSDIVTVVYNTGTGAATITDNWVDWAPMDPTQGTPDVGPGTNLLGLTQDTYQNYNLICATSASLTLTAVITRAINTGDGQDRVIVSGNMPVVYAWGTTSLVTYHSSNRGSSAVTFFGPTIPAYPSDANGYEALEFSSFTMSAIKTQYVCQMFDVGTTPRHVIQAQVLIQGAAATYAHHLLVHACGTSATSVNTNLNIYTSPNPCQSSSSSAEGNSPLGATPCNSLIYGWAKGGGKMVIPSDAGMVIGQNTRYIVVEVHLNNRKTDSGVDISTLGVNLTTTTNLRKYNATSLTTGDPGISFPSSSVQATYITAGLGTQKWETMCSPTCTNYYIPSKVSIFSSFLHLHSSGKQIWLTKTSSGSTSVVDYRQYWNFGFQVQNSQNYSLTKGDQLNLHCTYDATLSSSDLNFGLDSTKEMCMAFLFYYPAITNFNFCGYYQDKSNCGSSAGPSITETNPVTGELFILQ